MFTFSTLFSLDMENKTVSFSFMFSYASPRLLYLACKGFMEMFKFKQKDCFHFKLKKKKQNILSRF